MRRCRRQDATAMDGISRLVEHVVTTSYDRLPPEAVQAVKTFVLDSIGVGVAGSGEMWAPTLAACARTWGDGTEASVWCTTQRLPAPSAAMVNAYQIHGLEFDCVHEAAVVHPMATLLSALLADAERRGGADGRTFITAVAVGVDVAAAIGMASRAAMRFFRPATAGAFGAVAALGALRGLDAERLADAFGVVYGAISGTLQPHVEGSRVLAMQMGFNARAALTAVDLATAGLGGPREVLEGMYGYFNLFEGGAHDLGAVLAELGRVWRVAELAHKPFPSGRLTHGVIDALRRLQTAHGFTADQVTSVRAFVPPLVRRLVGRPDVPAPSASHARLCLPFVAATALLSGTVDVPDFRDDRLGDPRVHELARRIEVVPDGNPDENAMVPQRVEVRLAGGMRHELTVDRVLGSAANPLSRAQHLDKFRRCWTYGASKLPPENAERLIDLVDRLESVSDVRELAALTVPA
jgi:2-methylcitrate dehydratase PrpD